jgi:nucleotide-binding universal stress UspA family protein
MYRHVIVPIDGSQPAFDAIPVGARFAAAVDGTLELVTVCRHSDAARRARSLKREIEHLRPLPIDAVGLLLTGDSASEAIADVASIRDGSLIVMSSHGRGRSSAVLGSTTDEVLRRVEGATVVVGPTCDVNRAGDFTGAYLVPLDGSVRAESVLPIVASWTSNLGGNPWLVQAGHWAPTCPGELSYLGAQAHELHVLTGCDVGYQVVEADYVARSIVDFAADVRASLIFMATHGRTGLARLRSGSVAAEVVRHAPCPVVMMRPTELVGEADPNRPEHAPAVRTLQSIEA